LEILQDVIATTLAEVMGIDSSSIDSEQPLASLGLDSLMGMELRTGLESKLGFEIPMSSLLDDPSVASLANVANEMLSPNANSACKTNDADAVRKLEQGSTRSKKSAHANRRSDLVTLGGVDSALPPLFCVHPVGGDLRCYDGFARATRSRLVYGLRAHGLQAGSTPHTVFEQMIEDYILAIRNVRPNGPYCLMGWSTGGIFAYEIANRLLQQSLPVKPLIMVDTPLPSVFEKVDLNDNAKFLVDLIEFANYFAGTTMEVTYPDLRNQSENDALDCVLKLAIEHNVLPAQTTPAHLKRLVDVCRWHVGFLQSYIPPALDFAAHLIRPEDTSILSEAARQQHTDDFGWGQLVDLRMQRVSGHHFTMMTGHNAGAIAKVIDDLLLEDHSPSGVQDANSQLPIRPTTSGLEE
jgi:thioesterase domain-containing protein/acyl carrier protein